MYLIYITNLKTKNKIKNEMRKKKDIFFLSFFLLIKNSFFWPRPHPIQVWIIPRVTGKFCYNAWPQNKLQRFIKIRTKVQELLHHQLTDKIDKLKLEYFIFWSTSYILNTTYFLILIQHTYFSNSKCPWLWGTNIEWLME